MAPHTHLNLSVGLIFPFYTHLLSLCSTSTLDIGPCDVQTSQSLHLVTDIFVNSTPAMETNIMILVFIVCLFFPLPNSSVTFSSWPMSIYFSPIWSCTGSGNLVTTSGPTHPSSSCLFSIICLPICCGPRRQTLLCGLSATRVSYVCSTTVPITNLLRHFWSCIPPRYRPRRETQPNYTCSMLFKTQFPFHLTVSVTFLDTRQARKFYFLFHFNGDRMHGSIFQPTSKVLCTFTFFILPSRAPGEEGKLTSFIDYQLLFVYSRLHTR